MGVILAKMLSGCFILQTARTAPHWKSDLTRIFLIIKRLIVTLPFFRIFLLAQLVLSGSLFAELSHRAVIGAPFNGTAGDLSERVQVQVGSFASLVDTNGLHASAEKTRLPSGSATQLRTFFLFDDGTQTKIDPASISWSIDSPDLTFQDNSLLAKYVENRRTVRVRASGQGFESSFLVFILPGEPPAGEEQSHLPDALRSAVELESADWRESDWFGVFYDAGNGWIYHADHGWLSSAPTPGSSTTAWFWSKNQQWLWTGEGIYPHLFRNRDAAWLYFFKQALPSLVFYNHQTEQFEKEIDD